MKKRGLSTIVIVLIIILLSLVAVGVVWIVIRSLGDITDTYDITEDSEEGNGDNGGNGNGAVCEPDCTNLQCDPDPVCGEECGPCSEITDDCINGVCVPEDCEPEPIETTCGTWICGTRVNNCGAKVSCGDCSGGQMCQEGICVEITPINTGIVEETWPGTSGMYFGSSDLSINVSYGGYYIEFLESEETDCLFIAIYKFPILGYEKSHIGFNFETLIKTDENYQIWEILEECQA